MQLPVKKNPADSRKNVKNIGVDFATIFQKEVDIVKPDYIIIMSTDSKVYQPIKNSIPTYKGNILTIQHINSRSFKGPGSKKNYYSNALSQIP